MSILEGISTKSIIIPKSKLLFFVVSFGPQKTEIISSRVLTQKDFGLVYLQDQHHLLEIFIFFKKKTDVCQKYFSHDSQRKTVS